MEKTMIAKTLNLIAAASFAVAAGAAPALAAEANVEPLKHQHWHFSGPFGTYDKDALQRGYQVYETVCSNCHGVELLSFRNLGQKGGPFHLDSCPEGVPESVDCSNPNENPIVKAAAAKYKYQITDGPDDTGDMFQRAPLPSDRVPSPYANEQQARAANGGALPPDLSLIIKARHHGPDYVYSLLTGFADAPETVNIAPGQHYNPWFPGDMAQLLKPQYLDEEGHPKEGVEVPPGGVLAMAPPLSDGIVDYADESTPETVDQYAKDVVEFLTWASEPKMEARKKLGVMSLAYLIILAGLLYWSYREIWSKEH
ncbi:MAG: cytochrome c1 [Pseudomonadota bacterium]|nr:cytochrome c1 [Pseudomonadota bacterium]